MISLHTMTVRDALVDMEVKENVNIFASMFAIVLSFS